VPIDYKGPVYERPDGLRFGVRRSIDYGETIDVIESGNSGIKNGFKVHWR
jgi:hypothetical protein